MSSNNENTTTTVGLCFANPFCVIPGRPGGGGGLRELTALPLGPVTEILDVLTGSPCAGRGGSAPPAPPALQPWGWAARAPGAPSCDPAPFTNLQAAALLLTSVPGSDKDPWDGLCPRPTCTPPQRLASQQIRHRNPAVDQTPVVKVLRGVGGEQATCPSHLRKPMS